MTDSAGDPIATTAAEAGSDPPVPRRRRRGMLLVAVALLAGAVAVVVIGRDRGATLNAEFADSIRVERTGNTGVDVRPGTVGISVLVGVYPNRPITLLDVRPYAVSAGVDVPVVRAVFDTFTPTSASGHRNAATIPLVTCVRQWPVPGYGPSYPVAGLRLVKGDAVQFAYYVRSDRLGAGTVTGYRIRYRTENGKVHTVVGDQGHFTVRIHQDRKALTCDRAVSDQRWARPEDGFPA